MVLAETLAVVAMAVQFVLPSGMGISITLGHRNLGVPIRWVLPLLLISIAGGISLMELFSMYWRLAHVAIQPGH
jgi:hypothetical protein